MSSSKIGPASTTAPSPERCSKLTNNSPGPETLVLSQQTLLSYALSCGIIPSPAMKRSSATLSSPGSVRQRCGCVCTSTSMKNAPISLAIGIRPGNSTSLAPAPLVLLLTIVRNRHRGFTICSKLPAIIAGSKCIHDTCAKTVGHGKAGRCGLGRARMRSGRIIPLISRPFCRTHDQPRPPGSDCSPHAWPPGHRQHGEDPFPLRGGLCRSQAAALALFRHDSFESGSELGVSYWINWSMFDPGTGRILAQIVVTFPVLRWSDGSGNEATPTIGADVA